MTEIKLPFVLGLAGRKGAGKTHLATALEERGWVRLSFADGVRELALALDPYIEMDEDGCYIWRLSDHVGAFGWDDAKKNPEVRRILQTVGTEIGRSIDPDLWVKKMAARLYKIPAGNRVVIDDVRFINEADKIRHAWGGQVALLDGGDTGDMHESEVQVGMIDYSYVLTGHQTWTDHDYDVFDRSFRG